MKNHIKYIIWIAIILLPSCSFAWKWQDLWRTADQQGVTLFQAGKAREAAQQFKNRDWRGTALYRSNDYLEAYRQFNAIQTSDGQYNAGNAAAYLGKYQEAIRAYDKAVALNANNTDAVTNREVVKKLLNQQQQEKDSNKKDADKNNNQNSSSSPQQSGQTKTNKEKTQAQTQDAQTKDNQPSQQSQPDKKNPADSKQKNETTSSTNHAQNQDENKNQLLRRLADDPGGLLQQKFLRDYFRRHGSDENATQGET